MKHYLTALLSLIIVASACTAQQTKKKNETNPATQTFAKGKSDAEWKKILTPIQYEIMVKRGTETPFHYFILNGC